MNLLKFSIFFYLYKLKMALTAIQMIKQRTFNFPIFFIIVPFLFLSCKPDKIAEPVDVGYDYFPLFEGKWAIYDVDSTVWDDFTSQTYHYHSHILEKIESSFTDITGKESYRIERYYRNSDTANWVLQDVWSACLTASTAEKVEENIRYIKLAFPVRRTQKWNGNALNYLDTEEYSYKNLFQTVNTGQWTFDSTVTVEHKNNINLIEEDIRYEVFAKHAGLVKKYVKTVKKNIAQPDVIVSGILVEYTIQSWGP